MGRGKPADPTAPTVPAEESPPPSFDGDKVGRYLLVGELGRGAMGQVYRGFDPDLGRRVAVKLVAGNAQALAPYLISEARMLATVSHPNIVPVFDVGQDAGRLYIVMELVDGESLAGWLDAAPRTLREIVRAWCAAGRGLAAAHASGVVHRDFKASNVLIGKDGHVRVADFGLARPPDDGQAGAPIAGTRDYMAPEVVERGAATEAVDQYAFCMSLARALGDVSVPRRIKRILERGVATDPAARWPTMTAVVDALERALRVPRQWWIAVGAVAVAGAGVASWSVLARDDAGATCELATAVAAREVPGDVRAKLAAAVRDTPRAGELVRIDRLLDTGLAAWSAQRDAACATPARAACLDARLGDLAMVIGDEIDEHGATARDLPLALVRWRDALAECATGARDADTSREYRHAMARSLALWRQGRTKEAIAEADAAIAAARDPKAVLRAKLRRSYVVDEPMPSDAFTPLYVEAQQTGDVELPAQVALAAAQSCLEMQTWTCARDWIDKLADSVARQPATTAGWYNADLAGMRGELALRDGNPAVASAMFQDELRRIAALRGSDSFQLVAGWTSLASAQLELRHYPDAVESSAHADAIVVHWLGEDHPHRASALAQLGAAKLKAGDRRGGIAALERALALRVQLEGDTSPHLASTYNNLAAAYQMDGKLGQSLALIDRALACYAKAPSSERGRELLTVRNGAMLADILARPDTRARIDKAVALATTRLPADHPDWATLIETRAIIEYRTGDLDAADRDLREAATRMQRVGDRMQSEQAVVESFVALVALRRHQPAAAERALALADRLGAGLSPTGPKRAWLDEIGVELAIARGDLATARARLAPIGRLVEQLDSDPRTAAHYHLLAATVAADRETAAAERAKVAATLEAAEIPADAAFQDCAVCRR